MSGFLRSINFSLISPHGDHPVPLLVATISTFLVLTITKLKGSNSRLVNIFSIYTGCIGLWLFGLYELTVAQNPSQGLFWGRFLNVAALFIPATFLHFVNLLIEPKRELSQQPSVVAAYVLSLLYMTMSPTHYFIFGSTPKPDLYYFPQVGTFYPITVLSFFVFVGWGHWKLYRAYLHSVGLRRNHFKYVFVAYLVGYMGGTQAWLPMFGYRMIPYSITGLPICMAILSYAVVAHHLMDVSVIIRKTIIYAMVTGVLTLLYMGIVAAFAKIFAGLTGYQTVFSSAVAAGLITICFQPLRKRVQIMVDSKFFRQYVDREEKLYELSREVVTHTTPEAMAQALMRVLQDTLHPKVGALYLKSREGSGFLPTGAWGNRWELPMPEDNPLARYFSDHPQPFVQEEETGASRSTRNAGHKERNAA